MTAATPPEEAQPVSPHPLESDKGIHRFEVASRIEHWVFMLSFTILGFTGLVQKFPDNSFSQGFVQMLGGIENVRLIHHIAATFMLFSVVYHIGAVVYKMYVRRDRPSMAPGIFDVRAAWQALMYNFGFSKNRPQQGRYSFEEKMEYWAVVWGTIIMAITGFMMWNPIATTEFLSGQWIVAAKMAHGWEAVLAVAAIILWHFYHVLIRTFNKSMFNGYLDSEEYHNEHPLELADLRAGTAQRPVSTEGLRRRRRIFFPVYGVIGALLVVGIYFFVAYEDTAIATVPPLEANLEVFVPLTPTPLPTPVPTKTALPGGLTAWEGGVGPLFQQRCVICHNPAGKIGGLDLSTYASALAGGSSGAGIVAGDPEASQVIIVQEKGGHPGQLSGDELEQIREWIANGAAER
jgi:formate dehydrogenase gamma subunit